MTNEEKLKRKVEEAMLFLAPKLDISAALLTSFKCPSYKVVEEILTEAEGEKPGFIIGLYNFEECGFKFPIKSLDNIKTIGHETTHYLHHQLNPALRKDIKQGGINRNFWWGLELSELVAEYGGIIYQKYHGISEDYPPSLLAEGGIPGFNTMLYEIVSRRGYSRAYHAFEQHGEAILSGLARIHLIETGQTLPRLLPITFYERKILPLINKIKNNK